MATSKYFNHLFNKKEQMFYDDFVTECAKIAGIDLWYVLRDDFEIDPILREPKKTVFEKAYQIEAYPDNIEGYEGISDTMTKFGVQYDSSASWEIPRTTFEKLKIPNRHRPAEGDLIVVGLYGRGSFTNSAFLINRVLNGKPNWQLGRYNTFIIEAELWNYTYDPINTGVQSVDQIYTINTNEAEINVANNVALEEKINSIMDTTESNPMLRKRRK